MINEANMQQILEMQDDFYSQRIGTVYGDFKVVEVWYDWEARKQMWKLECEKCGATKTTHNGRDYRKGKNKGNCGCEAEAAKAKIEQKKERERQKRLENAPNNPKWVGMVFGEWKVLDYKGGKGWLVRCEDCGRETYHSVSKVKSLSAPQCLCRFNYGKYNDPEWVGRKYGHLTIKKYANGYFNCVCDCGRKTRVQPTHLIEGKTKTCAEQGCEFRYRVLSEKSITHGQSHTRLYKVWQGMISRCTNSNMDNYADYGGRGIRVCPEWNDFVPFYEWAMKSGFDESKSGFECSIDRIDVNGNYEPSNCRWADAKVQRYNQRPHKPHRCKHVWTIDGETKPAKDWCAEYGLSVPMVMYRVKTKGMAPEQALTAPNERPRDRAGE